MGTPRNNWHVPRRTFLRGVGAAIALPWLESMSVCARDITTAGGIAADEIPKRAVFTFWGLGLNGRDYTPKEQGRDYALTPIFAALGGAPR